MARKTKQVQEEVEKARKKAEDALAKQREIEKLALEAEEEEQAILERTKESIDEICEADNLFCGVILTIEDVMSIVRMAITTKENIKIPYHIYFND